MLLVSLMEAADRVDSTTGVQMAYLKGWSARSHKDLELRMPDVLPRARHGRGRAVLYDAVDAARSIEVDVAYLDPPYNQHSYLGYYHVRELLCSLGQTPGVWGRVQTCRRERLTQLVQQEGCVSFSFTFDDWCTSCSPHRRLVQQRGIHRSRRDEALLSTRGEVLTIETDYKRYVGAQIGIHNPKGEKVGEVSHLRNKEYLYVVTVNDG